MTKLLDEAIATIRRLPEEEQDLAAEMLLIVADRHKGPYQLDEDERKAVLKGLEESDRGEFVSEEHVEAISETPVGLIVRFTPTAGRDLEEIRSYLVERSPKGAERVRKRIDAVLERLALMPLMGATTSERNVRVVQLAQHPYRIFYVVRDDAIDVVHVRHTSRRPYVPSVT